jgi:hypothetical protein
MNLEDYKQYYPAAYKAAVDNRAVYKRNAEKLYTIGEIALLGRIKHSTLNRLFRRGYLGQEAARWKSANGESLWTAAQALDIIAQYQNVARAEKWDDERTAFEEANQKWLRERHDQYDPPVAKPPCWGEADNRPKKDVVREQEKLQWAQHRDHIDRLNRR